MSQVIDSDEIETIIGQIVAEVTLEPVAVRLELVRVDQGSFFLQYHVRVIGKRLQINKTVGIGFTLEAFDLERLKKHLATVAADIRVVMLRQSAERN